MATPDLRDELEAPVEPLLPIEKKLIGWSFGIGIALLALLVLLNRIIPLTYESTIRPRAFERHRNRP
ncbi:hypothetical protein [Roseiarcus sp.]|uniref:hypothetical protein n=1 Tax=Roseiarcus sp. TaxID=1969460 RepID=UPI003D13CFF9